MKKLAYVVAGLALFFVLALVGLVLYLTGKSELDKNRSKTEAARSKRWAEKNSATDNLVDLGSETEVNKLLDSINQAKKDENKNEDSV